MQACHYKTEKIILNEYDNDQKLSDTGYLIKHAENLPLMVTFYSTC